MNSNEEAWEKGDFPTKGDFSRESLLWCEKKLVCPDGSFLSTIEFPFSFSNKERIQKTLEEKGLVFWQDFKARKNLQGDMYFILSDEKACRTFFENSTFSYSKDDLKRFGRFDRNGNKIEILTPDKLLERRYGAEWAKTGLPFKWENKELFSETNRTILKTVELPFIAENKIIIQENLKSIGLLYGSAYIERTSSDGTKRFSFIDGRACEGFLVYSGVLCRMDELQTYGVYDLNRKKVAANEGEYNLIQRCGENWQKNGKPLLWEDKTLENDSDTLKTVEIPFLDSNKQSIQTQLNNFGLQIDEDFRIRQSSDRTLRFSLLTGNACKTFFKKLGVKITAEDLKQYGKHSKNPETSTRINPIMVHHQQRDGK